MAESFLFGIFPRLIVATMWLLINMSLTVFSWIELVGHLPIYGVMAVLLVWTTQENDQRLWMEGVLGKRPEPTAPPLGGTDIRN